MRKKYSETTLKKLFALSGNICAFPGCYQNIVDKDNNIIGEISHIEAAEPGGERYNQNQTDEERCAFENLILLCRNHHKVTNNVDLYTVEELKKIKAEHEEKFDSRQYEIKPEIINKLLVSLNEVQINPNFGYGQQIITQSGDIIVSQGITLEGAKDLFQILFENNFPKLREIAKEAAKENVKKMGESFFKKASSEITEDDLKNFKDPDTQYILNTVVNIAARKDSNELREILSSLLVERIKANNEDLKRIVYNEAISTVSKLTKDQLKIITLCYLLRYTSYGGIVSWETFNDYLKTNIQPFLDFKGTNAEFQHIEYAGCGSIGISGWNLSEIYRSSYSFLFLNLIEKSKIDNLNIPAEQKKELIALDSTEDKYSIRFRHKTELEKYLKEKSMDEELNKKIINLYESHIKNKDEIKQRIVNETDIGKRVLEVWNNTTINHLSLTSVGIVIGATNFEQEVGEKINIDIWIH